MNKISSIHQLKAEKKRLREKQDMLEKKLQGQWQVMKVTMKPGYQETAMDKETEEAGNGKGLLKQALHFGFSFLAKKASEATGNKLEQLIRKKKKSAD